MRLTIFATVAAVLASPVAAQQTQADSTSTAQSYAGLHTQGDTIRSGSVAAPSSNSTAPCVVAQSFGIAGPGAGIGFGSGKLDAKCVTRIEAQILTELATMHPAQKRAAIAHFCRNDPDMQATMVSLGWCVVR